jgi:hypothetical protein
LLGGLLPVLRGADEVVDHAAGVADAGPEATDLIHRPGGRVEGTRGLGQIGGDGADGTTGVADGGHDIKEVASRTDGGAQLVRDARDGGCQLGAEAVGDLLLLVSGALQVIVVRLEISARLPNFARVEFVCSESSTESLTGCQGWSE